MSAIIVNDLTKTYRVGVGRARVREMLPPPIDRSVASLFPRWWTRHTFNALEDVSLEVPAGESIGLVGHNGAGKTTLLKLIAGVTEPTHGTIEVSGRIAALIDALVGFHPDLTGRENVYLLGAMHGFGRRAMASRIDRIFEFAEIEESADTPVKRYSAGMAARLGFSTITALDVEILLIDEVLAVGDAAFQRKCIGWLDEYRAGGGTLVFVSHNLGLVRSMTEHAVWINHGRVVGAGATARVLADYVTGMEHRDVTRPMHRRGEARKIMRARGLDRWGAGGARVREVHIDEPSTNGHGLRVAIAYECSDLDVAMFSIGFVDEEGRVIGSATSPALPLQRGEQAMRCAISPMPLRSGIYFPIVAIMTPDGVVRDRWKLDRALVVERDGEAVLRDTFGPLEIPGTWTSE